MGATSVLGKTTIDEYRGKAVDERLSEKLSDRSHDHFVRHELPRMLDKEGRSYAEDNGFVDFDGRPVRRGK